MDVCSWDWSIIATYQNVMETYLGVAATIASPIIVAVYIYNKWHDQKGKEVIANEAKKLLDNVNELKIKRNILSNMYLIEDIDKIESTLSDFRDKNSKIIIEIDSFIDLIKKKKFKTTEILLIRNVMYDLYIKITLVLDKIKNIDQIKTSKEMGNIGNFLDKYQSEILKLIDILVSHALYMEIPSKSA